MGRTAAKNTLLNNSLLHISWRNQKLHIQAKVKRIQHHQTIFTTYTKETSLGREEKDIQKLTQSN